MCSVTKVFLEISQSSQENTCARDSFLINCRPEVCNFIKKETLAQVFSCEFVKLLRTPFNIVEHLWWLLLKIAYIIIEKDSYHGKNDRWYMLSRKKTDSMCYYGKKTHSVRYHNKKTDKIGKITGKKEDSVYYHRKKTDNMCYHGKKTCILCYHDKKTDDLCYRGKKTDGM